MCCSCGVTRVVTTLVFFGSEDGTVPPKQQLFVNGVLKKEQTLCTLKPDGKTCLTTEAILLALEGTSVSYTKLPVVQTSGPPTLGRSSTGPNNAFQVLTPLLPVVWQCATTAWPCLRMTVASAGAAARAYRVRPQPLAVRAARGGGVPYRQVLHRNGVYAAPAFTPSSLPNWTTIMPPLKRSVLSATRISRAATRRPLAARE
jgi:hypothetical protein